MLHLKKKKEVSIATGTSKLLQADHFSPRVTSHAFQRQSQRCGILIEFFLYTFFANKQLYTQHLLHQYDAYRKIHT